MSVFPRTRVARFLGFVRIGNGRPWKHLHGRPFPIRGWSIRQKVTVTLIGLVVSVGTGTVSPSIFSPFTATERSPVRFIAMV